MVTLPQQRDDGFSVPSVAQLCAAVVKGAVWTCGFIRLPDEEEDPAELTDVLSSFFFWSALTCRYVGNVCGAAAGMWLFQLLWVGATGAAQVWKDC